MELVFKLSERPSSQIKELRLLSENNNVGIYKVFTKWANNPDFNSYIRVIYKDDNSIQAIDFDGGPMIGPGYKLDDKNTVFKISNDIITNELLVVVKCNEISN